MAVRLTRMIASRGLIICGSGTFATSILFLPAQQTARILSRQLALERAFSCFDLTRQSVELFGWAIFLGKLEDFSFLFSDVMVCILDQREQLLVEFRVDAVHS